VRILIDYRPALRERTGVGQYVHELASALVPQLLATDSLVLFSSSWKDRLPPQPVPGAAVVDARVPVRVLNLAWHRLEWPPIERLAGAVDIAHSLHPLLMPARHAAQVITVHDLDFLEHPERTRAEIRRDYPRLAARHARRADLVVVNSDHTATLASGRLGVDPHRIAVCKPGAPAAWTPRQEPRGTGPILFVGTIEPRKNLPTLFAAYERVVQQNSAAPPLVLAGRTVEHSAAILSRTASSAVLSGKVRHLGYVTDEERYALYREASMLVLPSLDEGFGMTALEAMHVGVPVVASNRGALPEVIGTAGLLVDPLDEVALATAIGSLLQDRDRRMRLALEGRARAREFTWTASAGRLLGAYREVLARRRRERRP
jgi:glycosyltransferase involved in cell wall biosynthesis